MKRIQLTLATLGSTALILSSGQTILAEHGSDDPVASPSTTVAPASEPSHSDSGSTSTSNTSGSAFKAATPETRSIQKIEVKDDSLGHEIKAELSDDKNQTEVTVEHKNGKAMVKTKAKGSTKTSEKELSPNDVVSLTATDSKGKKHIIKIKSEGEVFKLEDGATTATTKLPIKVDDATDTLAVITPDGQVELKIEPDKAVETLREDKLLDEVDSSEIELETGATEAPKTIDDNPKVAPVGTSVVVRTKGIKHVNFLGLFPVDAHETASVNVQTGAVKVEDKPWFLNILGFLFSNK